jgi:L-asparaginase/Glu-tRNA(Gln) amidotransferase subunit D
MTQTDCNRPARGRPKRRALVLPTIAALAAGTGAAVAQEAGSERPRIAIFSGPTATIQNVEPLVTSDKARLMHGLEPIGGRFDALRPQRIAAPVTVYIEAFSAHPLERDAADLYAPPDGFILASTGTFSETAEGPDDTPVYVATLAPEDGLYMLPYMARQSDGSPWDGYCAEPGAQMEACRVPFYPDASRIVEQIDRFGIGYGGRNNLMSRQADFDFIRAAPSGGYRNGLPEAERTDVGEGDIPPEVWGEDFFTYAPHSTRPGLSTLANATNIIQTAMANDGYEGGFWLEGSPTVEESIYFFGLLVDTDKPLVGLAAQRTHGQLSEDGSRNLVDATAYVTSGVWRDDAGADKVGAVMIQEEVIIAAREVQKGDDRPGAYLPTGGHGGVVGGVGPVKLTYAPMRLHTHRSDVRLTVLPETVPGVQVTPEGAVTPIEVQVKDAEGLLVPAAMPQVTMIKHGQYAEDNLVAGESAPVEILTTRAADMVDFGLKGFVLEGTAPYGSGNEAVMEAVEWAALRGMPVVRVGRGNAEGFVAVNENDLFIEGENLTTTKARMLLMASMLKLGSLPVPSDPDAPTTEELEAIRAKVGEYQQIFLTH